MTDKNQKAEFYTDILDYTYKRVCCGVRCSECRYCVKDTKECLYLEMMSVIQKYVQS